MQTICWSFKKWQRTFCIMGQQVYVYGKLNINVGVEKTSFKMRNTVISIRPEAEWSNHEQVENFVEIQIGGPNPFLWK